MIIILLTVKRLFPYQSNMVITVKWVEGWRQEPVVLAVSTWVWGDAGEGAGLRKSEIELQTCLNPGLAESGYCPVFAKSVDPDQLTSEEAN